jgi:O-antigen/teichoic acid export membrane protein
MKGYCRISPDKPTEKMLDEVAEMARDSARGGFSLFLGDASSTAILAVGFILIARLLGPSGYGLYSLAIVVPALFTSLINFGIDEALVRFPAKFKAEGRNELLVGVLRSGLKFRLWMGVMASIVGIALSDFLATRLLNRPEMGFYVKLASLAILFQPVFSSAYSSLVGLGRMDRSAMLKVFMSMAKALSAPTLIVLGFGVAGAILGHVLGYVVAGAAGLFLIARSLRTLKPKSGGGGFVENLKLMIGYGYPLYLSSLASIFIGQLQLILLAFFVSNFEVGNFNAAVNLTTLLTILITPMATAIFPAFSTFSSRQAELKRFFGLSMRYVSLLLVPASIAVITLSRDISRVVYGPSYVLTPLFLSLYAAVFLLVGLGYYVLGSFFNGIGATKLTLRTNLVYAGVFISSAPLLTRAHGVLGLISAFLASNLVSVAYGLSLARNKFEVDFNPISLSGVYVASIFSALPVLLLSRLFNLGSLVNLAVGIPLFLMTYLTSAPLFGAVHANDIRNLETIFGGIGIWPILKPILAFESRLLTFLKK